MTHAHARLDVPHHNFVENQDFGDDDASPSQGAIYQNPDPYAEACSEQNHKPQESQSRLRSSPLTPQTWQEAEKLAKLLCKTKMVPAGFENPDLCLIAILQGLEMGLPPMTALQRMALVEGKLTLWGDGALALVLKSGLCTSITEWMGVAEQIGSEQAKNNDTAGRVENSRDMTFDPLLQKREEDWIAFCEVTRIGWDKPIRRSFSTPDAKRASLWKKEGPWSDYPKRMLQMRARAFALRDAFADVLGGLYLREELEPRITHATAYSDRNRNLQNRLNEQSHPEIPSKNLGQPGHQKLTKKSNFQGQHAASIERPESFQQDIPAPKNLTEDNDCAYKKHPTTKKLSVKGGCCSDDCDDTCLKKTETAHSTSDQLETCSGASVKIDPQYPSNPIKIPARKLRAPAPQNLTPRLLNHSQNPHFANTTSSNPKNSSEAEPEKIGTDSNDAEKENSTRFLTDETAQKPLLPKKQDKTDPDQAIRGKTTENHDKNEEREQKILEKFKLALQKCRRTDDLEGCRLEFQPKLDELNSQMLDKAAQAYLEQEDIIERLIGEKITPQLKRRKPHPQIRHWKAQYRPYQHKKSIKSIYSNSLDQVRQKPDLNDPG